MHNTRIIARLDIKGENLIKGIHLEGLRVVGDPHAFAKTYFEQGADELLFMDAVASLYQRNHLAMLIARTAQDIFIPITVGGGIRSVEDARKLLRTGADKIAVNTAAIQRPQLLTELANQFGSQCVVLSIDAKRRANAGWEAMTDGGREHSGREVADWVKEAIALGAGEVLLTSIDQEGTGSGFDLALVQQVAALCTVPLVASGGLGKVQDGLDVVLKAHADAVASAQALHYQKVRMADLATAFRANSLRVRHEAA